MRHTLSKRRVRQSRRAGLLPSEPLEPRQLLAAFRPPAVPLITSDPYLSVWSEADKLTDKNTQHWTGSEHSLVSLIRIDGTTYRLMGNDPSTLPAFPQTAVQVLPTRSIYDFDNGHVHVTMTFMQPAIATDLTALSLPLSYINWSVRTVDGGSHAVQIYDSVSSELAVNTTDQQVSWQRGSTSGGLTTLRVGTTAQTLLSPAGDGVRIDWGYAYLVANASQVTSSIGANADELAGFQTNGQLTNSDDANTPRAVNSNTPVMAMAFNLGNVGSTSVQRHVIVAYDELKSISYFGDNLVPYWRRNVTTVEQMLTTAETNYSSYVTRTAAFDSELMADMTAQGGSDYAQLGALAYRQTFAATGLAADSNGQLLAFPKENSSNGDISTVDVLYPMFPQFLLFSPTLAKASLQPVMDYSASSMWTFPNAPHDLGTYPSVFGRPDGGEAMPVEETANMLIMLDAIAKEENSPEYAAQWWPLVTQWANFLKPYAQTPGLQLTTDDFLGVITNSTNLAVKAIVGLGAYADLARRMGDPGTADAFIATAQGDVQNWITQSLSSDGSHWLLSYGQQNSSAQQYNLVWDQLLGTNLFPASVAVKEIAYEKSVVTPYGVPIRSTTNIVGVDWSVWAASMATNTADFQALINPIYNYVNVATNRVPFTDKYDATNLGSILFRARPVIGGVFAKMLADPATWSKWASRDTVTPGIYAGLPVFTSVVPSANESPQTWRYRTTTPSGSWTSTSYNDSTWSTGTSAFGTAGTPGLIRNTNWSSADIYLRRTFTMPSGSFPNLQFEVYHDESVEIYINGTLAASATRYTTSYVALDIADAAKALLIAGNTITLAVHCHQTTGGQGVDVGLVDVKSAVRPGRVSGTVSGGLAGMTVYVDANNNGVFDTGEISTTTTSANVFNLSYVPAGTDVVRVVLPTGYTQQTPSGNGGITLNMTAGGVITGQSFVVQPPLPPAPSTPDLISTYDTGDSVTDNVTSAHTLVFSGFADPNTLVKLLVNGVVAGQANASGSGLYNVTITLTNDGSYAISATANNGSGTGPASGTINVTLDTTAPTIGNGSYDRDVTQDVSVNVGEGRAAKLDWQHAIVTNLTTGLAGPAIASMTPSADGNVARLHFSGLFADGRYRITFPAGSVTDLAGNAASQYDFTFTQLAGDLNGDAAVDFADLLVLAKHYNTTGNTFSTGNLDYSSDGSVDFADLMILAKHYNTTLPPASEPAAMLQTTTASAATARKRTTSEVLT